MKQYSNVKDVHLMIWENNPLKRAKQECQTNINVPTDKKLEIGDRIYIGKLGDSSYYEVTSIDSIDKSSLSDMNYYRTKTMYFNKNTD